MIILAISFNDLATTVPFENSIDTFDLRGDHLRTLFEHAVKGSWQTTTFDGKFFTQVSGNLLILFAKFIIKPYHAFTMILCCCFYFNRNKNSLQYEK